MLVFAVAHSVKGGWLSKIPAVKQFEDSGWLQGRITDGTLLSTTLLFLYGWINHDLLAGTALAACWIGVITSSMGEEAGAIGRWGHWWGDYKDRGFDRAYGVKKGIQRGCFNGAGFVLIGGSLVFIPVLSIGFVVAYWIGNEIYYRIHKTDSWEYAEPLYGLMIGWCYAQNHIGCF